MGPELDYVIVQPDEGIFIGKKVIICKELLSSYAVKLGENPSIVEECKGSDLVGQGTIRIFEYFVR